MDYNQGTPPPFYGGRTVAQTSATDVLKRVYVRMFIGLLITAFVALGVASSPAAISFIFGNTIMLIGIPIVMIAMAIMIPVRFAKMSTATCMTLFFVYSALMGAWLAPIFLVYKLGSIAYTFFITAGTFGAMSVYGYFTKSDLTKMGTYLMMALFGLIIAMLVNIFLKSSTLEWIVSIVGVLIFVGLTAWDTQQIKQLAYTQGLENATADKLATMGAFNLYLDFINLFLFLLRFFGSSRD
ncbi:MAG: Bax inhibitor-1/YccA family protein [Prevotella sp.]|nr:Bax inhibitor-1/YccA family protein [Bacteroides sp.]MCM1366824.1 Bax inhibitor-1/YccA family protein [Prevotella sp.]MCM1437405.1 Bax inhibitor-1/YccA family protein [Prevotella sp.]